MMQSPHIVFVKTQQDFIFGYYMPLALARNERYMTCENCWIFSLARGAQEENESEKSHTPLKFPVRKDKKFIAFYQSTSSPCLGSTLQGK